MMKLKHKPKLMFADGELCKVRGFRLCVNLVESIWHGSSWNVNMRSTNTQKLLPRENRLKANTWSSLSVLHSRRKSFALRKKLRSFALRHDENLKEKLGKLNIFSSSEHSYVHSTRKRVTSTFICIRNYF